MKADDDTLRDALKTLDTSVLLRLRGAMYEVCGAKEMDLIIEILRARESRILPWERSTHSGGYTYVKFCSRASAPEDPEHQRLEINMPDGPYDLGCTCGLRMFDHDIKKRMRLSGLRDNSDPKVWPIVRIEVNGQRIPHFAICGAAKAPFDPRHAPPPSEYTEHCICGEFFRNHMRTLGEYFDGMVHVDCTGGPGGCKLDVSKNLHGYEFRGKLFPCY